MRRRRRRRGRSRRRSLGRGRGGRRSRSRSRSQRVRQGQRVDILVAQREGRLAIVGGQHDSVSRLKDAALSVVPRDLGGRGQITLGDGHLGAQGQRRGVRVGFASLDGHLEGLVDRRVGGVRQSDLERVVEALRFVGQLALHLLGHREGLVSVGVSACAVPQHLRDRVDRFARDVVRDGVGELADDVAGALGPLDAGGQHNDGRLVGGDLAELHGHLGGRALDLGGVAERTVRGVLVAAQTLGSRRVRDDEGVGLRVVLDRVAVEAPARTGGGLVDD